MKIQDAMDLFTGNSYIIAWNDPKWTNIEKRLQQDGFTPYNYIYFLVFHLSGHQAFQNICKKNYVTSDETYKKFFIFMTTPQALLKKSLEIGLKYSKACNSVEALLELQVNPVPVLKRYAELTTEINEDLEKKCLPYLTGHPHYIDILGQDIAAELLDKYKKRGLIQNE